MISQSGGFYHTCKGKAKNMKTLLITAIGSFSARTAIEAAKELGMRVIGCDIYPKEWVALSGETDAFYRAVPAVREDDYIAFINGSARPSRSI